MPAPREDCSEPHHLLEGSRKSLLIYSEVQETKLYFSVTYIVLCILFIVGWKLHFDKFRVLSLHPAFFLSSREKHNAWLPGVGVCGGEASDS